MPRNSYRQRRGSALEVLAAFTRLGCTSFGGPVAHIGFFRDEFVLRRRWLDEGHYADLVALCQFLPGPASSQVGFALGMLRAGYPGALAAFVGFTAPSALVMLLLALGLDAVSGLDTRWLHGLKLVAVAVVAGAVWGMGRNLCATRTTLGLALAAAVVMLVVAAPLVQLAVIVTGALAGLVLCRPSPAAAPLQGPAAAAGEPGRGSIAVSRGGALSWLVLFLVPLLGLPLLGAPHPGSAISLADAFYRSGALVFGGGHVLLPLLEAQTVATGWVERDVFLAGYGAAQGIPGPLFTFATFLGAHMLPHPGGGIPGAVLATAAIFLPGFALLLAALPHWLRLRGNAHVRAALTGVNASVVGILLAALYDPVFTGSVSTPLDMAGIIAAFFALTVLRVPPWLVVLAAGLGGLGVVLS